MMSFESVLEKLESIESLLKEQTLLKKKVLTFKDAMYLLGVSKNTLYELMRQKKIPAYRPVRGKVFFIQKELRFWIMSNKAVAMFTVEKLDREDVDSSEMEV